MLQNGICRFATATAQMMTLLTFLFPSLIGVTHI